MLGEGTLPIILIVAILLMAVIFALILYGVSYSSIMELWDYESWSEPFGYALLIAVILVGFSLVNIVLVEGATSIALNITGAVVPLSVAFYLLARKRVNWRHAALATSAVAILTFPLVRFDGTSILIDLPQWLLPIIMAVMLSLLLAKGNIEKALPLAYIAGSVGMLVGGDIVRILILPPNDLSVINLGSNGILDFIFLAGLIADGILLFGLIILPRVKKAITSFASLRNGA
jgi:hypothetical protein